MDELTLLRQLRADIDQASTGLDNAALLQARNRLLAKTGNPLAEPLPPDVTPLRPLGHPTRRTTAARWAPVLAVAAVAAVVAVLAVGAGVVHRARTTVPATSSYTGGPVPWSPAGVHPTTDLAQYSPPARAPLQTSTCLDRDFRLVSSTTTAAPNRPGWGLTTFTLLATGASPCAISDQQINATLLDAAGHALPTDGIDIYGGFRYNTSGPGPQGNMPDFGPQGNMPDFGPLLVHPGDVATGSVGWSVAAGPTPTPVAVALLPKMTTETPPAPPQLVVPFHGVVIARDSAKPPNESPLGTSTALGSITDVGTPRRLAFAPAKLSLPTPAPVRRGQVLSYTVYLENPTDNPISLAYCPEFIELVSTLDTSSNKGANAGRRGPLNCAAAPKAVAPHSSVAFQMEVSTVGLGTGPGSLIWQLVADGVAASMDKTTITVLP